MEYAEPDERFRIPDRDYVEEKHTRSMLEQRWGDGFPQRAMSLVPEQELAPGTERAYDLYAEPGHSPTFHLAYVVNPDHQEFAYHSFEDRFLWVSILIDYEPVEFEYTLWGPEREKIAESGVTTGLRLPIDDYATILDVSIPSSAFPEERMYEIALMSVFENRSVGVAWASHDRYALYYGGLQRPAHECFEPPLADERNEVEKFFHGNYDDFYARFKVKPSLLFPDSIREDALAGDTDAVRIYPDSYEVTPGERVKLNLSVISMARPDGGEPMPTVARPFVNGKPMNPKWHFTVVRTRDPKRREVNARKQFVFEAPEEPGTYDIIVGSWRDAYRKAYEGLPRQRVEGVEYATIRSSSNIVRFEVVDDTDQ